MTGDEEVGKVNGLEGIEDPAAVNDVGSEQTAVPAPIDPQGQGEDGPPSGHVVEGQPAQDSGTGGVETNASQVKAETESPPVVLPPIHDYDSDVVIAPAELQLPTRVSVLEQLIDKHRSMVETFSKEKEALEGPSPPPEEESEEERARRDEINRIVQELKAERTSLKGRNKALSKELFGLLERQERLKGRSEEIAVLKKHIDDLEWKIETEDIKIEQERKHLDEIKRTMRELRDITGGSTPDEITERTVQIQEEIDQNLLRMEEAHNAMLEKVRESNLHHDKYVDAQRKARELDARRLWLTRRVELHTEMGKFWEGQLKNARTMDDEESRRTVGSIRDSLLARMEEASRGKAHETAQGQDGERPSGPTEGAVPQPAAASGQQNRRPRGRPRKKVAPSPVGRGQPSEEMQAAASPGSGPRETEGKQPSEAKGEEGSAPKERSDDVQGGGGA